MGGKFTLDNGVDGGEPEQDVVAPQIEVTSKASTRPKKSSSPAESVSSHKEDGLLISEQAAIKLLAEQMNERGYHPVILFGSSNSGKTSMLLSLFAAATTQVELQVGVHLNDSIISANSTYGEYLRNSSRNFFQSQLTNFIEGKAAQNTLIKFPFFVPIDFTSSNGETVKIAFMEGNGEWFQPKRGEDGSIFTSDLNPAIELFIQSFQSGISFIYVLPFTQRESGQSDGYSLDEDISRRDAGLAIKGVIEQYRDVRGGKTSDDRHMMLVTKWDARYDPRNVEGDDLHDVLKQSVDDVKVYLENNAHYRTAVVAFQSIADVKVKNVRNYCSGRIRGKAIDWPTRDHDHYESINSFPVELWKWLYSGACGIEQSNPFPKVKERNIFASVLQKLMNKVVG